MTDDTSLTALLRSALPAVVDTRGPARDLWPRVASRVGQRVTWSWIDIGLAAAVAAAFLAWPDVLLLLVYHF